MAEAITLNIGNGAVTLAYNEIVYSKIGSGSTSSCSGYTWQIMLVINPMSIGSAFILPYSAWNIIESGARINIYYNKGDPNSQGYLFSINYAGRQQSLGDYSILMLLN